MATAHSQPYYTHSQFHYTNNTQWRVVVIRKVGYQKQRQQTRHILMLIYYTLHQLSLKCGMFKYFYYDSHKNILTRAEAQIYMYLHNEERRSLRNWGLNFIFLDVFLLSLFSVNLHNYNTTKAYSSAKCVFARFCCFMRCWRYDFVLGNGRERRQPSRLASSPLYKHFLSSSLSLTEEVIAAAYDSYGSVVN